LDVRECKKRVENKTHKPDMAVELKVQTTSNRVVSVQFSPYVEEVEVPGIERYHMHEVAITDDPDLPQEIVALTDVHGSVQLTRHMDTDLPATTGTAVAGPLFFYIHESDRAVYVHDLRLSSLVDVKDHSLRIPLGFQPTHIAVTKTRTANVFKIAVAEGEGVIGIAMAAPGPVADPGLAHADGTDGTNDSGSGSDDSEDSEEMYPLQRTELRYIVHVFDYEHPHAGIGGGVLREGVRHGGFELVKSLRFGGDKLFVLLDFNDIFVVSLRTGESRRVVTRVRSRDILDFLPCTNGILCLLEGWDEHFEYHAYTSIRFFPDRAGAGAGAGAEEPREVTLWRTQKVATCFAVWPEKRCLFVIGAGMAAVLQTEDVRLQDSKMNGLRLLWTWKVVTAPPKMVFQDASYKIQKTGKGEGEGGGGGGSGAHPVLLDEADFDLGDWGGGDEGGGSGSGAHPVLDEAEFDLDDWEGGFV
jgi:hypothetical protein